MHKYLLLTFALLSGFAATGRSQTAGSSDALNHVVYIEYHVTNLTKTEAFYHQVFDWDFGPHGDKYMTYFDGHVAIGFVVAPHAPASGGALVSIFVADLAATKAKVVPAGGKITRDIVTGTGGRRFQFTDPDGDELAAVGQ